MFYALALSIKPGLGMVESGVMMESTSLSPEYPRVRKGLQKRLALPLWEVKEPELVPYARHPGALQILTYQAFGPSAPTMEQACGFLL